MPKRSHRKRAALFLAAVLLPSAVLVGTTVHLINQQRELAVRRAGEERSLLALRVGQDLAESLRRLAERVRGTVLSPDAIQMFRGTEMALVTVAVANDGRLIYPWEMDSDLSASLDPEDLSEYRRLLKGGEEAEYRSGDLEAAARLYRRAAELAGGSKRPPGENEESGELMAAPSSPVYPLVAEARVNEARAHLRAGHMEEARLLFRGLAEGPPSALDQEGIPFSTYGMDGLLRCGAESSELLGLIDASLEYSSRMSLPALLAWREVSIRVADGLEDEGKGGVVAEVEEAFESRSATLEVLEELRRDFPALSATTLAGRKGAGTGRDETWIPYGDGPWIVGILEGEGEESGRVAVVRPGALLAGTQDSALEGGAFAGTSHGDARLMEAIENIRILPAGTPGGESLGPTLNGLRASFPPDFPSPADVGGMEGWFFRLLLPLILILTGFTAYLAWRDVRREEEAIRLRSQFVSSVTHELKTPLTSIRMFVETIRLGRHSSPEVQQEYLDTVVHETERLSRLINNVLDFARIDRGEKTYHLAPTDVGAAAREAARAVAYPLAQGQYELATEIAPDLLGVAADADALTQALLNLLSNAIKFSEEGSRIDLRVFQEGEDILLQVEDQGRGIAPRDREAIFREFVRAADAEREGIPGTGLGLPLVAHVAEAHGGRVEVTSEVGKGSTFTIRIPVGKRARKDEGP